MDLYCWGMTRKESSLPCRSQIWFCSLSNKLKKKKKGRKETPPCELYAHYHFPWISRSLWNPTRPASQTAGWNCTGKKRSLAGAQSWTKEQEKGPRWGARRATAPAKPGGWATPSYVSPATQDCHVDRCEVLHEKLLRKLLILLKRSKSIHSFENMHTSLCRQRWCPRLPVMVVKGKRDAATLERVQLLTICLVTPAKYCCFFLITSTKQGHRALKVKYLLQFFW